MIVFMCFKSASKTAKPPILHLNLQKNPQQVIAEGKTEEQREKLKVKRDLFSV